MWRWDRDGVERWLEVDYPVGILQADSSYMSFSSDLHSGKPLELTQPRTDPCIYIMVRIRS
jgi:hypothetical protein